MASLRDRFDRLRKWKRIGPIQMQTKQIHKLILRELGRLAKQKQLEENELAQLRSLEGIETRDLFDERKLASVIDPKQIQQDKNQIQAELAQLKETETQEIQETQITDRMESVLAEMEQLLREPMPDNLQRILQLLNQYGQYEEAHLALQNKIKTQIETEYQQEQRRVSTLAGRAKSGEKAAQYEIRTATVESKQYQKIRRQQVIAAEKDRAKHNIHFRSRLKETLGQLATAAGTATTGLANAASGAGAAASGTGHFIENLLKRL